ncbi:MAG: hypothetical protein O2983_00485 [Planctomycetota bacterium]|nr:hypothetical protein [Planctomycetota bacterium]
MNLECPHCKVSFTVADATPGKFVRCTSCDRRFLVSGPSRNSTSNEDFPPELIVFCAAMVLFVLGLVLATITTPAKSIGIVIGIGVTLLSVWKWQAIDRYFIRLRIQRAARRQAKKQAAAEAASAQAALESSAEQDAAVLPVSVTNQNEGVANSKVSHTEPATSAFPTMETDPAPESPVPVTPDPVVPVNMALPVSADPPSALESESLTTGLPEKYREFLEVAMTQSQWSRLELEAAAAKHGLHWDETFTVIAEWSRQRFGEPMLIEDEYNVWVQLPII